MRNQQIITPGAALLVVAAFSGCSQTQNATIPHLSITADRGTNVTMLTNSGHTFMLGKTTLNDSTRPMLITTPGTHPTADGAWRVEVSESLLAISRSTAARGEGRTRSGWSTVSPQGWKAQAGWFVFVENESRVWAYDGNRQLLLQTESSSGNDSTGATYSSRYPCAVPAEVFSRLSEPAQRAIQAHE